jgi:fatty-acyl-CoA synthase
MDAAPTSVLRIAPGETPLKILGHERGTERTFSYDELHAAAESRATGLAEREIQGGDVVALFARPTFDFVVGCFAVWRRGAVVATLPVPPQLGAKAAWTRHVNGLLRASSAKAVLGGEGDPLLETDVAVMDSASLDNGGRLSEPGPQPSDVALIQFTSGSTAAPKGIVLEHRAVMANLDAHTRRCGPTPGDGKVLLSWVPLHHDMGFIVYLLRPLCQGMPAVLMPTESFAAEPLRWIEEMSRARASSAVASNSAYGFVARELERHGDRSLDLSNWEWAGCGGEPIEASTLERFAAAASRFGFDPQALSPGWGLAEVTCGATAQSPRYGLRVDRLDRDELGRNRAVPTTSDAGVVDVVGVGWALDGFEVGINDERGEQVAERNVGEVVVKSPALMNGYLGDSEGTKEVLSDGWLRTGDLGYLADGHLFVTGRIKDVVIVDGANYHAADIERVVTTVPGVRKGGCVAIPVRREGSEKLGVIAETGVDPSDYVAEKRAIQAVVVAETGISPALVALVPPNSIPRTTSGKLQRAEARTMYEEGRLPGTAQPRASSSESLNETEAKIAGIWERVLGVVRVEPNDDFFELGGTSLQAVRVVTEIESSIGVVLPLSVLVMSPTLRELAASVDDAGGSISRTLIPFARADAGPGIFAASGAGGTAYVFRPLARELVGSGSFYAFEALGADARTRPADSIEEMAVQYMGEMKRASDGPYVLLGYSFGGVVAYEMAIRLAAEDIEARVILIDAPVPMTLRSTPDFGDLRVRGVGDAWRLARHAVGTSFARAVGWGRSRLHIPVSPKMYMRYLMEHARVLSRRYEPPSYGGPVDYVQVLVDGAPTTERHVRAWRTVASDLRVHRISAPSHQLPLNDPWVKEIASVVTGILSETSTDEREGSSRV